jgi:hypothetical protein
MPLLNTPNTNQKVRVIDRPDVVEIYANKVVNIAFDGGAIVLTLGVQRSMPEELGDPPNVSSPTVTTSVRLVLPPPGAVEVVNAMNNVMNLAANMTAKPQAATPPVIKKY